MKYFKCLMIPLLLLFSCSSPEERAISSFNKIINNYTIFFNSSQFLIDENFATFEYSISSKDYFSLMKFEFNKPLKHEITTSKSKYRPAIAKIVVPGVSIYYNICGDIKVKSEIIQKTKERLIYADTDYSNFLLNEEVFNYSVGFSSESLLMQNINNDSCYKRCYTDTCNFWGEYLDAVYSASKIIDHIEFNFAFENNKWSLLPGKEGIAFSAKKINPPTLSNSDPELLSKQISSDVFYIRNAIHQKSNINFNNKWFEKLNFNYVKD